MAEIEEINALLETETARPQLEPPERSDIDIIYEKNRNKSQKYDSASYEVAHYDSVDEKFYDDLDLGFETSVEQLALDRENERAVFRNTDDSYEVLEVIEASSGQLAMKGKISAKKIHGR